jgi:hypothetical protein
MGRRIEPPFASRPWAGRCASPGALPAFALGLALAAGSLAAGPSAAAEPAPAGTGPVPALAFDHFLDYQQLTDLLQAWAQARPQLVKLESLGKTPEGRELWFMTLTNGATGPAESKPALLVDGNMHAIEWTGGMAALNFTWTLLRDYGTDERVTRLLDTRTVYVLPRMTPDGVEATLKGGAIIRSAIRPAEGEKPQPGLRMQDVNGDGHITTMRYRDPNGPWRQHPDEPRLMIPRGPEDTGADNWRVVPEGMIEGGFNGETFEVLNALSGIDFGTFFPDPRDPVPEGAVKEPDAKRVPEVAAFVKAIRERPNIFAHVTCHNFGGILLTPPVNADEVMPGPDQAVFTQLGQQLEDLMGYEPMSYLDLRAGRNLEEQIPTEMGWLYNRFGIFSFITEFWNPLKAAGVKPEGRVSTWLGGDHPIEDELKLLAWNDNELGGKGHLPWTPFQHPQLGAVEVGGWDKVRYWYNPPMEQVQAEVAPHADWLVHLGLSSPKIAIRSFTATPAGPDLWTLRLVVENTGWLPTSGSQKAADEKLVEGVQATLQLPAGATLVEGAATQDAGQLLGRSQQKSIATWWGYEPGTPDRALLQWTVQARKGTDISATVAHPRAGVASGSMVLE